MNQRLDRIDGLAPMLRQPALKLIERCEQKLGRKLFVVYGWRSVQEQALLGIDLHRLAGRHAEHAQIEIVGPFEIAAAESIGEARVARTGMQERFRIPTVLGQLANGESAFIQQLRKPMLIGSARQSAGGADDANLRTKRHI